MVVPSEDFEGTVDAHLVKLVTVWDPCKFVN